MRETFNIFWYIRIKRFARAWQLFRKLPYDRYVRMDTWNGLIELTICPFFGHIPQLGSMEQDLFCKRCGKYLESLSNEKVQQFKREQKFKRILKSG